MARVGGALALAAVSLSVVFGQSAPPFAYGEALQKSIFFFDVQRSGPLGPDSRVSWRGPSALTDGADNSVDLTGGFYDAGDHVKFGFPMAGSLTMLAWGAIEYQQAFADTNQLAPFLSNLRWGTDYLLKASATPGELWGQVGRGDADHNFWGAAEVLAMARPSFRITATCAGTDLAAETAAALAASAIVFRVNGDQDYSNTLLARAEELFAFADQHRGKYSDCITDANNFYRSWSGFNDELAWGAAWLYRATFNAQYLTRARLAYQAIGTESGTQDHVYKWTHGWDDKSYGTYVLMAQMTGEPQFRQDAERWLDYWTVGVNGAKVTYTPGGLAWLDQWGSLRYSANTAFLAFVYADWLKQNQLSPALVTRYVTFAERQINYMLGDNPQHRSYVVGFGQNPPRNIHHRTAHGSYTNNITDPAESVHILYGALVGGPDSSDNYADVRTDFNKNEVALDYNASFVGALARMFRTYGGAPAANFPPIETPSRAEYLVEAQVNVNGNDFLEVAAYVNNRSAWPARVTQALTLRYFFTLDSNNPSDIVLSQAYNQCGPVTGPFLWFEKTYYIQITCENLSPAGQSEYRKQVQFRIRNPVSWNRTNDWSAEGIGQSLAAAPKITLYDQGELIWGTEPPDGGSVNFKILMAPALPGTLVGSRYSSGLGADGGTPPYSGWEVIGGNLPDGITLNPATGLLSGTASREQTATFTVRVRDQDARTATQALTIRVAEAPVPTSPRGRRSASVHEVVQNSAVVRGAEGTPLRLQYRSFFTGAPGNTLGPQFKIFNTGSEPLPLSELTLHYYFTMERPDALNFWCDWAAVDCKNVRAQFIAMGDRVCLELSFAAGAGTIPAGTDSGDVQTRLAKKDWTDFDQSNDYSFDGSKHNFEDWDRITVYRNGTLVWGIEP